MADATLNTDLSRHTILAVAASAGALSLPPAPASPPLASGAVWESRS